MIRLEFIEPNDDVWNSWISDCETATNELVQAYQGGNPVAITNLYRTNSARYYEHPFYGKCAYCESKIETTSPNYVEHFRPKAGVRDINNNVVMVTINGQQAAHPGYYWLSYNWRNLLPTCWNCNTRHTDKSGVMVGKGNRFPVTGAYGINPGDEINESCDLINPMFEDPADYLSMDNLGFLQAKPNSVKGATCISFFGLNTREALVNGRKREYDNITRKVRLLFTMSNAEEKANELAEIAKISTGQDEYTIAAKKAIKDVLSLAQEIQNSIQVP